MTQLWQRQQDDNGGLEPMLWFGRFDTIYRPMGTERSLLGAVNLHRVKNSAKKGNSVPGAWEKAFNEWNWKKRAEAWDIAELERIKQEFQERADAWRAGRFDDAEALREKANQLLRLPVVRRTGIDGDGISYTVEAVSPTTLTAAARILKTADELARITTRETLPTVEQRVNLFDWRKEAESAGIDPAKLDELRERLTQEIYDKMMEKDE